MRVDLKVVQLLCSRLCHDLAGSVGAVNAGLELLEEAAAKDGGANGNDALALAARSARQTARRLAFYRMAFGFGAGRGRVVGGGDAVAGGDQSLAKARDLAAALLDDGRINLSWPEDQELAADKLLGASGVKLLLNLILLGLDSLPRGGGLGVHFADLSDGVGMAIMASGPGARLKDDYLTVMTRDVPADALTAYNVQAHFTWLLAEDIGAAIEIPETAGDEVRLAALMPTGRAE